MQDAENRSLARDAVVLAWLRHAHYQQPEGVPSAHLPHPLTDKGTQQATRAGEIVADWASGRGLEIEPEIESSSLLRAWQTATLCAEVLRARLGKTFEVREHDALMERSVGAAANLTMAEIEAVVRADPRRQPLPEHWKSSTDVRVPFPGAESLRDAGIRVANFMRQCAAELSDRRATSGPCIKIVVGHGASMRHAACELGLMSRDDVAARSMHYAQPIFFAYRGGDWSQIDGDWKHRDPGQARD